MTPIQITLDAQSLQTLFSSDDMRELIEAAVNQILQAEVSKHIGDQSYRRMYERHQYRNGYRMRRLTTRVGALFLRVPQPAVNGFTALLGLDPEVKKT